MRVREKGYNDYGLTNEEVKRVYRWCEGLHSTDDRAKLYSLALETKSYIADDLVYSLVKGLSYDDLAKISHIGCTKNDFYAYRRQLVSKIISVYNLSGKV